MHDGDAACALGLCRGSSQIDQRQTKLYKFVDSESWFCRKYIKTNRQQSILCLINCCGNWVSPETWIRKILWSQKVDVHWLRRAQHCQRGMDQRHEYSLTGKEFLYDIGQIARRKNGVYFKRHINKVWHSFKTLFTRVFINSIC
jgi:hypothetical protein